MDFFVSCFAVYFITTSVMLGEVATNLQAPSKENLITIANNEQIPLAAETRSDSKSTTYFLIHVSLFGC